MTPWLSVVGLGEDGLCGVSPAARPLIEDAEALVGGARHLAMVPADHPAERIPWASPLSDTVAEIVARRGKRVCVLATGDPMWHGIGVTLARCVPPAEMTVVPGVSAYALACARLGWPLADVETLTLHGRPLDVVRAYLAPGARIVLLANDGDSPREMAAILREAGYGESRMTVLECMGGENERCVDGDAERWRAPRAADLNTIAIECRAGPDARVYARVPGLPDDAYLNDGQLTKREVRAVTLAALAPLSGRLLWDVGAGCGSIAIEWLRSVRGARAVAVERSPERCAFIAGNAAALGVPQLEVVSGQAPAVLAGLEAPDAVFVGGGLTAPGLVEACWDALAAGGRLVANAVTVEGEAVLARWHGKIGGEMTRLAVSRLDTVGAHHGWRPAMPVTQLSTVKR